MTTMKPDIPKLSNEDAIAHRACAMCQAKIGEPCTDIKGRPIEGTHSHRHNVYWNDKDAHKVGKLAK